MASNPRYVSATNATLPMAIGQLIGFVRDPKNFRLNDYVQLVNAPSPTGVYHVLDRDRPVRVVTDAEFAWEDGDEAPSGNTNKGNFSEEPFICQRRAIPFTVGEEAAEQHRKNGSFDPVLFEAQSCACQAMVLRTRNVMTILETAGNYGANTDTATSIGGGKWDAGTSTAPYLMNGIMAAAQQISLQTNSVVKMSDLRLILNPTDAKKIAAGAEVHDYLKSSPYALPAIRGELSNPNELWGLPTHLYGMQVCVEDAVYVSTRPLASGVAGTRGYIKTSDSAVIVSRAGGIEAPYGARSFSTIQLFYHKYEMTIEQRHDTWNKREDGRVIDWNVAKLVAAPAGFLITDIIT